MNGSRKSVGLYIAQYVKIDSHSPIQLLSRLQSSTSFPTLHRPSIQHTGDHLTFQSIYLLWSVLNRATSTGQKLR